MIIINIEFIIIYVDFSNEYFKKCFKVAENVNFYLKKKNN